jgi:hypothetical protein
LKVPTADAVESRSGRAGDQVLNPAAARIYGTGDVPLSRAWSWKEAVSLGPPISGAE